MFIRVRFVKGEKELHDRLGTLIHARRRKEQGRGRKRTGTASRTLPPVYAELAIRKGPN